MTSRLTSCQTLAAGISMIESTQQPESEDLASRIEATCLDYYNCDNGLPIFNVF